MSVTKIMQIPSICRYFFARGICRSAKGRSENTPQGRGLYYFTDGKRSKDKMKQENFNDDFIESICRKFGVEGEYKYFETLVNGHINSSFKVYFFRNGEFKDYCLAVPVSRMPAIQVQSLINVFEGFTVPEIHMQLPCLPAILICF